MNILLFLLVIFVVIFLLIFTYLRKENKDDSGTSIFLGATIFAGVFTGILAFSLFFIIGSTKTLDTIFSLNISFKQIILIGILFFIYNSTVHNVFETVFEVILGKNIFALLCAAAIRVASFYILCIFIKLNENASLVLAVGISLLMLLADLVIFTKSNDKATSQ